MLFVDGVTAHYGEVAALRRVSIEVETGEIVALLGANGAGKTSTLRSIIGLLEIQEGSIEFLGEPIHQLETVEVVRRGMSMVFEGRRVFPQLTVRENLQAGGYLLKDADQRAARTEELLNRFPRLAERESQLAGNLSGGEQQMLAIARALMAKPPLLLMDEPSMGLAPLIVDEVFEVMRQLNDSGTTILLVEQNATRALELASRAYVLETGQIVLSGSAAQLAENEEIREAYLGG